MARCWMKSRGRRACSGPSARCRLSGKQHAARARSKSKPSGLATVRFACRRFERMLSGISGLELTVVCLDGSGALRRSTKHPDGRAEQGLGHERV